MKKKIHYGDEYDKNTTLDRAWRVNGHTISLWSDGNLTCDCMGWIYKRANRQRECIHVRERYAELRGVSVPNKSKPNTTRLDGLASRIESIISRGLK
jgi:hypothetical protein